MKKSRARVGALVSILLWGALGAAGTAADETAATDTIQASASDSTTPSVIDGVATGQPDTDPVAAPGADQTAEPTSGADVHEQILANAVANGDLPTGTGSLEDLAVDQLPAPAGESESVTPDPVVGLEGSSALASASAHATSSSAASSRDSSGITKNPVKKAAQPKQKQPKTSKKTGIKTKRLGKRATIKLQPGTFVHDSAADGADGTVTYAEGLAELHELRRRMRIRWAWVGVGKARHKKRFGKAALSKAEIRKRLHHEPGKKSVVHKGIVKAPVERIAPKVSVKAFGG